MRSTRFHSSILCFVAAMAAACASAAINDGVAVTALPAPDGDGAYVFGNANYTTSRFDDGFAAGLAYPVWDEIGVPAGASVKFVGGVALSSLPAGCTFDFSGATHVFATDAAAFGSGFAVPEGVNLLLQPCTVTVNGTTASFAISSRNGLVDVPLGIDGTFTVGREANVVFGGAVTGSDTGLVYVNGYDRRVTFGGPLAFDGTIKLNASQRAARIVVSAPAPNPASVSSTATTTITRAVPTSRSNCSSFPLRRRPVRWSSRISSSTKQADWSTRPREAAATGAGACCCPRARTT
jgi:hypothetical protein